MADFQSVAQQFVTYYYETFDNRDNRGNLAALYRPTSMLTFESTATMGVQDIVEKLKNLPFDKIQHRVDTIDAQPGTSGGGQGPIVVLVTGALLTDDESKPMSYVQVFQLQPEGGSYFVQNDLFKLVYPAS